MTNRIKHGKIRTIISFLITFTMVFGMMPWQEIQADAFNPDNYKVESITIGKTYNAGRQLERVYISIVGTNLKDAGVYVNTYSEGFVPINSYRKINDEELLQFSVSGTDVSQANMIGNLIRIGSINIDTNDTLTPSLTGVTPLKVKEGENLQINGSRMDKIGQAGNPKIVAKYGKDGSHQEIVLGADSTEAKAVVEHVTNTQAGLQDIIFINESEVTKDFPANPSIPVKIQITHTYKDQFRIYKELDLDGIEMTPNRGIAPDPAKGIEGDTVYFKRDVLDSYDVYFLKAIDGTDPFTPAKRGTNKTFKQDGEITKDILTVKVPKLEVGEYYVVLTNPVNESIANPEAYITQEYVITKLGVPGKVPEKFTIIDGDSKPKIIKVEPNKGPSDTIVTITGNFLLSHNINGLNTSGADIAFAPGVEDAVVVDYGSGTYNGIPITSAKKEVKVYVGGQAKFNKIGTDPDYRPDAVADRDLDRLSVIAPVITDVETNPQKDVVIEMTTTIVAGGETITIKERAEVKKGYTFEPKTVIPQIESVMPDKIEVVNNGVNYKTKEELVLAIKGKNFMIHRYQKADGTTVTKYPVVRIKHDAGATGGEILVLNKNMDENVQIKVMDQNGKILDGTTGNELGTKILITIPQNETISAQNLGAAFLEVVNPIKNSDTLGADSNDYPIQIGTSNASPVIDSVEPDIVTIEGGVDTTVRGSNFAEGVKVFIDGTEVSGVKRELDSQGSKFLLKFKMPPGSEGKAQLQVMNPDGGIDTYPIIYVKSLKSDPKITSFAPNKGTRNTLVFINGQNFMKPDPSVTDISGIGIYRLIGTRVFLGGKDINTYNMTGSNISLADYRAPNGSRSQKLMYSDGGKATLSEYAHSVVLYDDANKKYYTYSVATDTEGTIFLSDGTSGNTYTVTGVASENDDATIFTAKKGTKTYQIEYRRSAPADTVTIREGTEEVAALTVKTPYAVDSVTGEIVGNRVKVIDSSKIIFYVPQMPRGEWYDLGVVNPDTKSDSRTGQNGFLYILAPDPVPTIENIYPNQGSTDGGYTIEITGTNFESGVRESTVIIGGVIVDPKNVTVSPDNTKLTVVVPPYPGDLAKEVLSDRKTVPVVVQNSNGGTASKEDGFTYIIPGMKPEIDYILPTSGSAAGGEDIRIYGGNFRYAEPYIDANGNGKYDDGESFTNIDGSKDEDENPTRTDLSGRKVADLTENEKKILPKVYFGNQLAEITDYTTAYITVKSPQGTKGTVDVFVQNNDYGTSNKVKFEYKGSSPTIKSIIPNVGKKQGKDKIEINGTDFKNSNVKIYGYDPANTGNIIENSVSMTVVRFGDSNSLDISNETIAFGNVNDGRIVGGTASVTLRDVTIAYNAGEKSLTITAVSDGNSYTAVIQGYDNTEKYIPLSMLKSEMDSYSIYEMIKVKVDTAQGKLIVARGYAPYEATNEYTGTQLTIRTPSYHTIGKVPVVIINPDGGEVKGSFEYKNPDSNPTITNITKEGRDPVTESVAGKTVRLQNVVYSGGNIISIIGTDFRENAKILIGDVLTIDTKDISYQLPNKLTFTMPGVKEDQVGKLFRVIVINEDGGSGASDETTPPLYIQFIKGETSPSVEAIVPNKGPSSGGTSVTITGKDFREGLSVFFGETKVPDENVTVIDYKTIKVITPPHEPGKVEVKIENPDGSLVDKVGTFTYLSTPKIIAVVDPLDPTETSRIRSISVLGGQEIKLKGSGFSEGARVVFAPVIESTTEDAASGTVIYIEEKTFILKEGTNGTDVKIIDSETLTVKTPQGKMDSIGIIVINSDGGASDIYKDIKYGLPELAAPTGVVAELVYDRYIKVHWSAVTGAEEYEIYVVIDNTQQELIGNTELTSFVYQDLEPYTTYKFVVKAVGDFGSSKPSAESNTVKTGSKVGPPDTDGGLEEKTKIEKVGNTANVMIGTKDDEKELVIDLTRGDLAGSNEVIISMPASVVANPYAKSITVNGKDFRVKFSPNAFYTSMVQENKDKKDAGVRFQISPSGGNVDISGGKTMVSTQYSLKAAVFVGQDSTAIDYLRSSIQVTLDMDKSKMEMRNIKLVDFGQYEGYEKKWIVLATVDSSNASVVALTNRLGEFAAIGRRR